MQSLVFTITATHLDHSKIDWLNEQIIAINLILNLRLYDAWLYKVV